MEADWRRQLIDDVAARYSTAELRSLVAAHGSPLHLLDLGAVRKNYEELRGALPGVHLHFAVKCLPDRAVLQTLSDVGSSFDVATLGEMRLVRNVGIGPQRCLFTHPIVRRCDVEEAVRFGIRRFVIDSEHQLDAVAGIEDVEILLRIAIPNEEAMINLSAKFGIAPIWADEFLELAAARGVRVAGVSFHAGSQMHDSSKMIDGIRVARKIFDEAARRGRPMSVLDIGGGFPARYGRPVLSAGEFCAPVRAVLGELFPSTEIIAEPGRLIAAEPVVAVSRVMGKSMRNGVMWYYLDDGVYGTYSGVLFERGDYPIFSLRELEDPEIEKFSSVLAGPTCDSVDVISQEIDVPAMDVGDIIVSPNMGAYSAASSTDFNLFPRAVTVVTGE